MAHDVFISHSARDKPYADAVCAKLESRGIRCWIAPRDIEPGMDWGAALIEAIDGARVMLLVFSSHANGSPQISREVERAVSKGLVVVPVRIEDIKPTGNLEYFLGTPHWLDAITPPFARHLDRIADSAKFWLERIKSDGATLEAARPTQPARNEPIGGPALTAIVSPRTSSKWITPAIALALIAALGTAGYFGARYYSAEQRERASELATAAEHSRDAVQQREQQATQEREVARQREAAQERERAAEDGRKRGAAEQAQRDAERKAAKAEKELAAAEAREGAAAQHAPRDLKAAEAEKERQRQATDASALPTAAGVVITQEQHVTNGQKTHDEEQIISVQGNKQKVVTDRRTIITDLDKGMVYIIDPKQQTYFEMEFPPKGPMAQTMAASSVAAMNFKETGTSREIAGYKCNDYNGGGHMMSGVYNIQECFSKDAPGAEEFSAFERNLASRLSGAGTAEASGGEIPEGVPLELDATMKMGSVSIPGVSADQATKINDMMKNRPPIVTTTIVQKIEPQKLASDTFIVPTGFTRKELPVEPAAH